MTASAPRPALGPWHATALVAGNMIGSGVFLLPASLAVYGAISIAGWVFTSAGAMALALVFARLAALAPRAGGPYAYTREAYGDFAAFWIAWGYWISICTGNAAIATAFSSSLEVFFPVFATNPQLAGLVTLGAVWAVTAVNARGVRTAGIVQLVTTALKLLPLLLIGTLGLLFIEPARFLPLNPSGRPALLALSSVATLTLWSFLGLESATIPARDVRDPARTIPRATVLGTALAALVYILSTTAVLGIVPRETLKSSGAPFALAARTLWGGWGYYAVGLGAAISCLGALNGWILLQGQLPAAAAADGLFPRRFGALNRRGVPIFSLVFSSGLITALLVLRHSGTASLVSIFEFIILLSTLTTLIPYVFCSLAEPLIRMKEGAGPPPRGTMPLSLAAFAYSVWAVYGAGAETVLWGFLLLLFGLPVWVWQRREKPLAAPLA